jgi:hypothetical protein
MAIEMRRARQAAVRQKLALDFHRLGPTAMAVSIKSVGPGTAFDVQVALTLERLADGAPAEVLHSHQYVLLAGESRQLFPPGGLNDNVNRLPAEYRAIRLSGTMRDATGGRHVVDESIADLQQWRQHLHESRERFVQQDPERRLADAFKKHFDDQGQKIAAGLHQIARMLAQPQASPGDSVQADVTDRSVETTAIVPTVSSGYPALAASHRAPLSRALRRGPVGPRPCLSLQGRIPAVGLLLGRSTPEGLGASADSLLAATARCWR